MEVVCIQVSYIHVGSVGRIMPGDELTQRMSKRTSSTVSQPNGF